MDGFMFVTAIEAELKRKKISKSDFYNDTGISSATFSQWRNKIYSPSSAAIKKVEDYLGITLTFEQKEKPSTEIGEELNAKDMALKYVDDLAAAGNEKALWEIFERLSQKMQKK